MECSHDDLTLVKYIEDAIGMNGHYEVTQYGYECVNCGEQVEYDSDKAELDAEAQLMELLGK